VWRKRLIAAAIIAVLGGGGYLAWRLTHPHRSDRELINELFDRIERGIETKQPRMVRDAFSPDYRDAFGFTKRDLHRISLELLRIHGVPQVVIEDLKIEVHGREADASLRAEVSLQEAGAETRQFSGALTFKLRKQRGRWLITSTAGWQGAAPSESEF
jgi:hypothetical protein